MVSGEGVQRCLRRRILPKPCMIPPSPLCLKAAYGYAELTMRTKLKGLPVKGVSLARSNLLKDGETIDLMVVTA